MILLYPEHVGRDGCRTPIPWMQNAPYAGFSTTLENMVAHFDPHLRLAVDTQNEDEDRPEFLQSVPKMAQR